MIQRLMRAAIIAALLPMLFACAAGTGGGLNSIQKTNRLSPGMNPSEVKAVLGDPGQTQFVSDKWVWKYSLHEVWKGYVPYYLVFTRKDQKLESWYADEAEYQRQQQLWLQAFPPTHKQQIDLNIR